MASQDIPYPVTLAISREAEQSRITNFPLGIGTLIRGILLIPHYIALSLLGVVAVILYFLATFAILFTGKYPESFFKFILGVTRWNTAANGYLLSFYDKYPPFSLEQTLEYPLSLAVSYPEESSRLLNFPFLGYYIRGLLLIPHFIIVMFLAIAMYVAVFIAQFAILFTGSFPEGMHSFCAGVMRWSVRLNTYMFGLTDRYTPFSTT